MNKEYTVVVHCDDKSIVDTVIGIYSSRDQAIRVIKYLVDEFIDKLDRQKTRFYQIKSNDESKCTIMWWPHDSGEWVRQTWTCKEE